MVVDAGGSVNKGDVEVEDVASLSVEHLVVSGLGVAVNDLGEDEVAAHVSNVVLEVGGLSELGGPELLGKEVDEVLWDLSLWDVVDGEAWENLDSGLWSLRGDVVLEGVEGEAVLSGSVNELSSSESNELGEGRVELPVEEGVDVLVLVSDGGNSLGEGGGILILIESVVEVVELLVVEVLGWGPEEELGVLSSGWVLLGEGVELLVDEDVVWGLAWVGLWLLWVSKRWLWLTDWWLLLVAWASGAVDVDDGISTGGIWDRADSILESLDEIDDGLNVDLDVSEIGLGLSLSLKDGIELGGVLGLGGLDLNDVLVESIDLGVDLLELIVAWALWLILVDWGGASASSLWLWSIVGVISESSELRLDSESGGVADESKGGEGKLLHVNLILQMVGDGWLK